MTGDRKTYFEGTHRTRLPSQTLASLRPQLPRFGITRIANVTGLDRVGVPVFMVTRPNARALAVSQGKGIDADAARVSGVMEAVESWHAENVALELRLRDYATLRREVHVADPDLLVRSQAGGFDEARPLLWVEGRDLARRRSCWLPLETVSTDYTLPPHPGSGCFAATSNGLASGNTLAEATSHALCEVVERDAVTLWKLGRARHRRKTGLDPASVDDGACAALLERFAQAHVDVKVWDVTSDVGVAAFVCLSAGADDDWADPEYGSGCHPSRAVALARALTEAAQARVSFIAGSRDDMGAALYAPAVRASRRAACIEEMRSHDPARRFGDVPDRAGESVAEDVDTLLGQLAKAGLERAVVVDLSRDELAECGIHVVRAVVPGLEGAFDHEQGDYTPGPRARALMPGFVQRLGTDRG